MSPHQHAQQKQRMNTAVQSLSKRCITPACDTGERVSTEALKTKAGSDASPTSTHNRNNE